MNNPSKNVLYMHNVYGPNPLDPAERVAVARYFASLGPQDDRVLDAMRALEAADREAVAIRNPGRRANRGGIVIWQSSGNDAARKRTWSRTYVKAEHGSIGTAAAPRRA